MGWSIDPERAILVVDDNEDICQSLFRILTPKYNVFTANSIKEAQELLEEVDIGLFIIDYNLRDEIDGITYAKYVKTVTPLSFTIMLTGYSHFDLIKRALNEKNIDKFLIKPFESKDLLEVVDEGLASYSNKREISQMLQSSDGVKMAQNLLTEVFDEQEIPNGNTIDLTGVVISRNSIPVYSKFLNKDYLKTFTDTIFSGFMTAINMVGKEVFNDKTMVDVLKFGKICIYFKFYDVYQFCFIVHHDGEQLGEQYLSYFDEFAGDLYNDIQRHPEYFNPKNNYFEHLDTRLEKVRNNFKDPGNRI